VSRNRAEDRDGQLDSGRPDAGRADPEDQLGLLAAAAEGFVSPMTWGVESNVRERFVAAGVAADDIAFARATFVFDFGAHRPFLDTFRRYYGPTMNAFEAAEKNGRASELQAELEALFASQNRSRKVDQTTSTRHSCG